MIGCVRTIDAPDAESVVAINCEDFIITSEYNGKTVIKNGAFVINEDGTLQVTEPEYEIQDDDFSTGTAKIYYIDCSVNSNNITATISGPGEYKFIRVDGAAFTATVSPASGLINGAASTDLTSQYQQIHVTSDGTDYYF